MVSLDEALAAVCAYASPLGKEKVDLASAYGRILAHPVMAGLDAPRVAVSAMDGYAVHDADLNRLPARLPVQASIFPGGAEPDHLERGTCARIFTGAAVPAGADRVVLQEDVRGEDGTAVFDITPGAGRNIRAAGSDFTAGQCLLEAGRRLDARALVLAAASDRPSVEVYRRPRVMVLSTGDELVSPGLAAGQACAIPESVSFGVVGLIEEWGGRILGCRRLPDAPTALAQAAAAAVEVADVVVVTGGASVGERDFARSMFETVEPQFVFSKVRIKPGKPVWFARTDRALVLGLPGNPTSALVTARLFLAPLLLGLAGRHPSQALIWREARLTRALAAGGERESLMRGRDTAGGVEPLANQDSAAQAALADADVLIRRPASDPAMPAGAPVRVLDF